jgi:hypothetical protein
MDQQRHEMILETTHASGVDEWYCPTCGRRLLMEYQPNFRKTVLDSGDEYVVHSGGKGGIRVGSMEAQSVRDMSDEEPLLSLEDPSLAPWVAWLEENDFEDLWNDTD